MPPLHFSILIDAPREHVFATMLNHNTYEIWTDVFSPWSTYVGQWSLGSDIRFVGADPAGGGCAGHVSTYEQNAAIVITFDGVISTTGEIVDEAGFRGATESYTFTEKEQGTELTVELISPNMEQEMRAMFEDMWPRALKKLKEVCENPPQK